MVFEMQVVSHSPRTGETDPERLTKEFLGMMGYAGRKGPDNGIAYRIFYDCFLLHPTRDWTVEELAAECGTSVPSIYRHVNKLGDLDLIEDLHIPVDGKDRRAFRLRYGSLSKAWNHVEVHFQNAMESYRATVDHLETLLEGRR
ncbi:MAG: transcriptional regulator [Thermoplasmatota archaeon]